MTILLSGATGFLGSYLLKQLLADKHTVVILKRSHSDTWRITQQLPQVTVYDIDTTPLDTVFSNHTFDTVVNTVTDYGRKNKQISSIVSTNLIFSLQLLEKCVEAGVRSFINTGTLLSKEVNVYALSKHQFTEWMCFLAGTTRMINIKIEHMYGPKDDESKFIGWLIEQLKSKCDTIDLTSGTQKRDFIYIDDIVEAYRVILENMDHFTSFEEFELGSGNSIEVRNMIKALYETLGNKIPLNSRLNFGAIAYRPNEQMVMEADITKLRKLGWTPKTDITAGIQKLIEEEIRG